MLRREAYAYSLWNPQRLKIAIKWGLTNEVDWLSFLVNRISSTNRKGVNTKRPIQKNE